MRFSRIEMVSIMKLAVLMASADGKFASEEKTMIFLHAESFGVEPQDFTSILEEAKSLKPEIALAAVTSMTSSQKRYVTAYLGTIIASDGDIDDAEIKLWGLISSLCDLPIMSIAEAIDIMTNE